jgi:hypothetical protein
MNDVDIALRSAPKLSVLNPVGYPPKVTKKTPAPRRGSRASTARRSISSTAGSTIRSSS